MVTALISLIVGIIGSILYAEFAGRSGKVAEKLINGAVERLPRRYRDRMREEWAADAASQPTPASVLVRSLGFRIASETILQRERRRVRVARAARRNLVVSIAGVRVLLPTPSARFIKAFAFIDDAVGTAVYLTYKAARPQMNAYRVVLWAVFIAMASIGTLYFVSK